MPPTDELIGALIATVLMVPIAYWLFGIGR